VLDNDFIISKGFSKYPQTLTLFPNSRHVILSIVLHIILKLLFQKCATISCKLASLYTNEESNTEESDEKQ